MDKARAVAGSDVEGCAGEPTGGSEMLPVIGPLSPCQRLYALLVLGAVTLGALWALHPTLRHLYPLAPVYSYRSVGEVRGLGLPIYPSPVNRPYIGGWAGHHVGADRRSGDRTYRFETGRSFMAVAQWYMARLPSLPFETRTAEFTGDWGDWEASRLMPGGQWDGHRPRQPLRRCHLRLLLRQSCAKPPVIGPVPSPHCSLGFAVGKSFTTRSSSFSGSLSMA